jgi:4-amino-4-deoxy-L-arabinose transferase-like glycosyltransferase
LEHGSLRWLVFCGVMIGVAFNTKTLAGLVAAPALFAAYALTAPIDIKRRLRDLTVAGGVLLAVSASWVAAVDLTPAHSRPYVGGSLQNSELDLLLNYNGLGRIDGEGNGPDGGRPTGGDMPAPDATALPPPDDGGPLTRGPGPGAGFGGGDPGVLRLFNDELSAQASWLLPLALIGGLASLLSFERRLRGNLKLGTLIVFGGWLLLAGAVFSKAGGIFHPYYLAYLGPAIGGVVGISVATFWQALRSGDRRALITPVAFIATAVFEVSVMRVSDDYATWLQPLVVAGVALGCLAWVLAMRRPTFKRFAAPALALSLAAVLLPPAAWSYSVIGERGNANLPYVAPSSSPAQAFRPAGGPGERDQVNGALLQYLRDNRGDAKWLVATESSMSASGIIIATGEPVMAMGGFNRGDPAVSVESIARMVHAGELRFFLIGGAGGPPGADGRARPDGPVDGRQLPVVRPGGEPGAAGPGGPPSATRSVTSAVTTACTPVDASLLGGGATQLYDCRDAGEAIRQAGQQS